jgi:hypothetical protein
LGEQPRERRVHGGASVRLARLYALRADGRFLTGKNSPAEREPPARSEASWDRCPRTLLAQTSPTNRFGFGPTSAIALLQKALGPSAGAAPFVLINEL